MITVNDVTKFVKALNEHISANTVGGMTPIVCMETDGERCVIRYNGENIYSFTLYENNFTLMKFRQEVIEELNLLVSSYKEFQLVEVPEKWAK